MRKTVIATAFTLTGTIIGAGILGLPYVFAKSGFLLGTFWMIILSAITIYIFLCLGELTLKTQEKHQLAGYTKKYLGNFAGKIMFFAFVFGIYAALIAYLIGEGESLSQILPGNINPAVFALLFWLTMTLLLREGLKGLKKVETWGVIAIITLTLGIFIYFLPQINLNNLSTINPKNFFLPMGVTLFALLGFTSIPELRQEIKGKEKFFKKAIILGASIPIILYILFTATFVGVLGKNINEVATLSFGPLVTLLGIFTMTTSYFVLSFSLKDTLKYDLNLKHHKTFFFTSLLPLILFAIIYFLNLDDFVKVIGFGGAIAGGLEGILILLAHKKSKTIDEKNKQTQISMPSNWPLIIIISIILIVGIITQFV